MHLFYLFIYFIATPISRTVDYKGWEVLLKLYKSLNVRPQLEFCTAAWSPHYKKDNRATGKNPTQIYTNGTRTDATNV